MEETNRGRQSNNSEPKLGDTDTPKDSLTGWKNSWSGVVSLVAIALCAVASALVVGISNGKNVNDWKISPAVWLAIFSGIGNVAFSSALATGIAVRFWLHASGGGQLSQLHYVWDHGRGLGLFSALRAGPTARTVAIMATSAYIVQFSSGPLLQRSTHQANQPRYSQALMNVDAATRIPEGWFGANVGNGSVGYGRRAMSQLQQWWLNSTIIQPDKEGYRCQGGTCLGDVRAAGFTYSCTSSNSLLDMSNNATAHGATVFSIEGQRLLNSTGHTILQVTLRYVSKVEGKCQATVHTTTCDLGAAIIDYPISITNSTLTLRHSELLTPSEGPAKVVSKVEYDGDSVSTAIGSGVGILGGLDNFIALYLYDNATIRQNPQSHKWLYSGPGGMLADIFFQAEPWDYSNHSTSLCGLFWASPTEYLLTAMFDYMFRAAMRVGRDSERQTFMVDKTFSELVFQSDWGFLGAGLAVILVGLCLVGALIFWGNWRLERPVTLSPLETATLFVSRVPEGNSHQSESGESEGRGRGNNDALRQVLRTGATIDQILAEARRMDVRVGPGEEETGEGTAISRVRPSSSSRVWRPLRRAKTSPVEVVSRQGSI